MSEYLVEVYVPRTAKAAATHRPEEVTAPAEGLVPNQPHVRLLGSIFVPEDETCFYLFDGQSGEAVREVATRSGLMVERVVEAVSEPGVAK